MNIFQHHLPFERLTDYAEDRLPAGEQVSVEMHLTTCSYCSRQVAGLRRLIGYMRRDTAQDAPISVVQRAAQLFRAEIVPMAASADWRHRILAVLQFDSLDMAPGFGMRSGKPEARQILYRAGRNEIDLRIEPSNQAWIVSGQVFGETAARDRVVLQGETDTSETDLNHLKEFVLPPVQKGIYTLVLTLETMDVVIDDVRVGS
jgi:hypothetical protein